MTSTDTERENLLFFTTLFQQYGESDNQTGFITANENTTFGIALLPGSPSPVGEPSPGVLAALAIGGVAFLGRKFRKSIKK